MWDVSRKPELFGMVGPTYFFCLLFMVETGFLIVGLMVGQLAIVIACFVFIAMTYFLYRRLPRQVLLFAGLGALAGAALGYAAGGLAGPRAAQFGPIYGSIILGALVGPIIILVMIGPLARILIRASESTIIRAAAFLIPAAIGAFVGYSFFRDWFAQTLPGVLGVTISSAWLGIAAGLTVGLILVYRTLPE